MKTPAPADLQRWTDELARNPSSLAFLPLSRAYRRQGRRELAMRLCLRGLEEHPGNVEAHALLALLYLEQGDRERAADEWSVVLRLKPGNFDALRGMGFRYLEENDIPRARQHLERAALIRPGDTAVQEALRLLRHRESREPGRKAARTPSPEPEPGETVLELEDAVWTPDALDAQAADAQAATELAREGEALDEPWAEAPSADPVRQDAPVGKDAPAPREEARAAPVRVAEPMDPAEDPSHVFDELVRGPILGALLLDARGLVLAGSLGSGGRPDDLGAILGGAIDEASRTVAYLELGAWRGIMMETAAAVVQVTPLSADTVVVLAAQPDAPTGWILRSAEHAGRIATRFLEAYS